MDGHRRRNKASPAATDRALRGAPGKGPPHARLLPVLSPEMSTLYFFNEIHHPKCPGDPVCHSKGPVFNSPFGFAPKTSDKKVRTNFIYVDNNPVERKLVRKAEEYRWNFLAYAASDHPFSVKLVLRKARYPLQQAVRMIKRQHAKGHYLSYPLLQRLFAPLTRPEKEQLTDFIVTTYNVIDYQYCIRFFDSLENMLISTYANTGSEYDISEIETGKTDAVYLQISRLLLETGRFQDIHDVLALSSEAKMDLFEWLLPRTDAIPEQIAKYLHIRLAHQKKR